MGINTNSSQRNYGIDLLRLVAAFYVIILHTFVQGGLFAATAPYSYQSFSCKMLMICGYCTINIFGIISGFVGYREPERKFTFSGYASLWIDVVFYSVAVTLIFMYIRPDAVTTADLVSMLFPVTKNLYWYFSAYTLVYFLAPFLNRMIQHCSEKELKLLFFLICFIIVPMDYICGCFSFENGYSALWLILLYLIGAIMKKNKLGFNIRPAAAFIGIIGLNACLLLLITKWPHIVLLNSDIYFSFEFRETLVSPFFLGSAILHVILFSQIHPNHFAKKLIAFAAPASFAVYIVNVQQCVWLYFMKDRFAPWAASSPVGIIVRTLSFSFLFVLAVTAADFCKRKLFRILKIHVVLQKLETILCKAPVG